MRRRVLLVTAAILALCLPGGAQATDADRPALQGYASWASGALQSPPQGVQMLDALAKRLVLLTAERRGEADLGPLGADPELLPAAQAHALDMLERHYVGHVTPDGLDPADRTALLHRRLVGEVGENVAEQQGLSAEQLEGQMGPLAAKIMDGWMQSPGHRENILGPSYTHLAIAAAARGQSVVIVQLFEARRALLSEPMPLQVGQGEKLPLGFEKGEGLSVPVQYAFARPGQPAEELVALELSVAEVSVEPGAYFLKFLFPSSQSDVFEVAEGPAIFVR